MGRRSLVVGDGSVELGFRSVSGDLRILAAGDATGSADRGQPAPTFRDLALPPVPPVAPVAPRRPAAPVSPVAPAARDELPAVADDPTESRRMEILRALEQGKLDVPTAMDRLAALDGDPGPAAADDAAGERIHG